MCFANILLSVRIRLSPDYDIFEKYAKKNQINFEKKNIVLFINSSYRYFCSNFELFFNRKLSIYRTDQKLELQKKPILTNWLKEKITIFLIQKFLLFKKSL